MTPLHTPLALQLRSLHLGRLRLTIYGACAAAGLILAVMLSARTGRRAGLPPEAAPDAGLFAVVSCFVASRLLLILSDPRAFLHFPLLILGLPSLTLGGMVLAGLLVWGYLRHKRLPTLAMLDAYAVPGALLAAFLELGHLLDGSEVGMPLRWHWTAPNAWGRGAALHPVALYGIGTAAAIAALCASLLGRGLRSGRVAALALGLGGLGAFALDLLSVPDDLFSGLPLEPGQMVALAVTLAGACLWLWPARTADAPQAIGSNAPADTQGAQPIATETR